VVNASQTAVFIPAEKQRGAAVRAKFLEQTDPTSGISKGNEGFA
jgi:hypothetical protein